MEEQPDLHLSNFISLRSRLRAAFPSLNPLSDYALLTVLTEAVAHAAPTDEYALVRLMPGHPERGDGQPATVAEREAVRRNMKVPENVGTSAGGNRPPRAYCGGMLPFTSVRGMGVPLLESRRLFPAVKEAMAVIDPFHRGGGGH